jgi:hypothetical protein
MDQGKVCICRWSLIAARLCFVAVRAMPVVFLGYFGIPGFKRGALRRAVTGFWPKSSRNDMPDSMTGFVLGLWLRHPLCVRACDRIKRPQSLHGNMPAKGESLHSQQVPGRPAWQLR